MTLRSFSPQAGLPASYFFPPFLMKSVNTVTLLGNVTRDPEIKATPNGQVVCSFGLATNRVWKDTAGVKHEVAEFHNIQAWTQLAELCGKYVRKGKPLYVKGYLKTHTWDDAEKVKHYMTEVIMQDMVLLGSKPPVAPEAELVSEEEEEEVEEKEAVAV